MNIYIFSGIKNVFEYIKVMKKVGTIKKSSQNTKIYIIKLAKPLLENEIIELKNIYISSKKELKIRPTVTKLT